MPTLIIIAHRGYWVNAHEKNTKVAFTRALENGFGIETDLRDLNGELVISHDTPNASAMKASEFSDIYRANITSAPVAINIKSDGLHGLISDFINQAGFKSVFVFDMAVPDMRTYLKNLTPTYTRLSEYETHPSFLDDCQGVWLDAFESEWYKPDTISSLLQKNKGVAIVSPELHGRPHLKLWEMLRNNNFHLNNLLSICTDFPMQAKEYFYAQN